MGITWSSTINNDGAEIGQWQSNQLKRVTVGSSEGKETERWTEKLSSEPLAFLCHNFLSKTECEHLIKLAKPHMERSKVTNHGSKADSSSRTSTGMFMTKIKDKVITDIEKRIADYTSIPTDHGESLQVLHYKVGQRYNPHFDTSEHESITKFGGHRMVTFLMYLSDVEAGGETIFPNAKEEFSGNYKCAKKRGISVKPKMGDALLFWNLRPDGTRDPASLHGGCAVTKGNKWSCTKWKHIGIYKR